MGVQLEQKPIKTSDALPPWVERALKLCDGIQDGTAPGDENTSPNVLPAWATKTLELEGKALDPSDKKVEKELNIADSERYWMPRVAVESMRFGNVRRGFDRI